jgi:hypothetical protein
MGAMTAILLALLAAAQEDRRSIWNGRDLDGRETYLGKARGEASAAGVTEVDGRPAIRISGEVWGRPARRGEFENYRFRALFTRV